MKDKNTNKIIEDEINLVMNKVVQCKKCKTNPIVWFRGFGCYIECPKCGKSTGGEIDPLDDVAEWNKINKKIKGEKNDSSDNDNSNSHRDNCFNRIFRKYVYGF